MAQTTLIEVAAAITDRIETGATVVGFTGAGISKASGIPTFRGEEGLWEKYRPEDVATINVLRNDPAFFWRFHDELRALLVKAVPNPAHFVLADMEEVLGDEVECAVITQNVDRLHQRAGSEHVIELHGDALAYYCMDCRAVVEDLPIPLLDYPPLCEQCGGIVRPDVVLFGENLPHGALRMAQNLCTQADVLLAIGTSGIVEPAASLPYLALASGALVVEVNPSPTRLTSYAHYSVQASANLALPPLWEEVRGKLNDSLEAV